MLNFSKLFKKFTASHENPKRHLHFHIPQLASIPKLVKTKVQALPYHFVQNSFNTILPSMPISSRWFLSFKFYCYNILYKNYHQITSNKHYVADIVPTSVVYWQRTACDNYRLYNYSHMVHQIVWELRQSVKIFANLLFFLCTAVGRIYVCILGEAQRLRVSMVTKYWENIWTYNREYDRSIEERTARKAS